MKALFILITSFISFVIAHREHVTIFGLPDREGFEAEGDVTSWESEGDLTILFKDGHKVLIHSNNHLHDVFINDHFSHTCAFRKPRSYGILLVIIKEKRYIKIAESPNSFCEPLFEVKQEAQKKKKKEVGPLRIALLKSRATKPKEKKVRFLM